MFCVELGDRIERCCYSLSLQNIMIFVSYKKMVAFIYENMYTTRQQQIIFIEKNSKGFEQKVAKNNENIIFFFDTDSSMYEGMQMIFTSKTLLGIHTLCALLIFCKVQVQYSVYNIKLLFSPKMHRLDTFLATPLSEAEGSVASFMALRALINRLKKNIDF